MSDGTIMNIRLMCKRCQHRRAFHKDDRACEVPKCQCGLYEPRRALKSKTYRFQFSNKEYPVGRITSLRQIIAYDEANAHKRIHERA